jgi:fumagillin biosynthesis dioxygenase
VPGSHRWQTRAEVPGDLDRRLVPFDATAGSILAMEGRVWHTSGRNVTAGEDRPLLFGYYTKPFVRPQWNFTASLRPEVQARCSPTMRYRLGLDVGLNLGVQS